MPEPVHVMLATGARQCRADPHALSCRAKCKGSRPESPPDSCCSATWRCRALSVTSASTAPCLTSTVLLHSRLKMMPSSLGRSSLQA